MSDILSNLSEARGQKREQQAVRAAEKQQRRERDDQFQQAWQGTIQAFSFRIPATEGAKRLKVLGGLLAECGWANYLPAIIETRLDAQKAGCIDADAELCVAEMLRLAAGGKVKESTLVKHLRRAAKVFPAGGVACEADNVRLYLRQRHCTGGELPVVLDVSAEHDSPTPPKEPTSSQYRIPDSQPFRSISPKEGGDLHSCCAKTFVSRVKEGVYKAEKVTTKHYKILEADIPPAT